MQKFNLVNILESDSSKKKYQCFEVKMGFEVANVMVPFEQSALFEEEIIKVKPKSVTVLTKFLKKFNGMLQ